MKTLPSDPLTDTGEGHENTSDSTLSDIARRLGEVFTDLGSNDPRAFVESILAFRPPGVLTRQAYALFTVAGLKRIDLREDLSPLAGITSVSQVQRRLSDFD